MFDSDSHTLNNFFAQPGAGYYIPFYQRPYSWDVENVSKLMSDICSGATELASDNDGLRFFGTLILLAEKNATKGVHFDYANLITQVRNVIDGQQRISTFAVLAHLISDRLAEIDCQLGTFSKLHTELDVLVDTVRNRRLDLENFFSVNVSKTRVDPARKPIIIRALDQTTSPCTDQWTLNGKWQDFYQSDVAALLAESIAAGHLPGAIGNDRLAGNVEEMRKWLDGVADPTNAVVSLPSAEVLLPLNKSNFAGFVEGELDLTKLSSQSSAAYQLACGTIRLLAVVHFLCHRSYVTVIECPNEALAFDMFQSLNATGTPLTAFEVFRPLVVNTLKSGYAGSVSKRYIDEVERYFETEETAAGKGRLTDQVLVHAALPFDGTELSTRFSQQRDWLNRAYLSAGGANEREALLLWLWNVSDYAQHILEPKKPGQGSAHFPIVNRLMALGLSASEADLAAFCIYFLREAQHRMAHYVLAVFYGRLLGSQSTQPAKSIAVADFVAVCKAVSAFFAMWAGTLKGFPDEIYRELFRSLPKGAGSKPQMTWKGGAAQQTVQFVKNHLKGALAANGVYDLANKSNAKNAWVAKAKMNLGYGSRRTVCRFALYVSAHDKAPGNAPGDEGLAVKGSPGSAPYLTCARWFAPELEVIEHIATRDKPAQIKYPSFLDLALYPGNYSVVDQIGNLTLWSRAANSSTYPEWPDKAFYYSSLTSLRPTQTATLAAMASTFGIAKVPPSLAALSAGTNYIAHLAPIAERGSKGLAWDRPMVERRTQRICELVFDDLDAWL